MISPALLIVSSSLLGQAPYYPGYTYAPSYGYGYGYYNRTPLPNYDPMRYARFYSGEGYYSYAPPVIASPEVINFPHPATAQPSANAGGQAQAPQGTPAGVTGVVVALDESKKQIKLQLPNGNATVAYGPNTHFMSSDGNVPAIKPGNLVNVNQNTITILKRSSQ